MSGTINSTNVSKVITELPVRLLIDKTAKKIYNSISKIPYRALFYHFLLKNQTASNVINTTLLGIYFKISR